MHVHVCAVCFGSIVLECVIKVFGDAYQVPTAFSKGRQYGMSLMMHLCFVFFSAKDNH